MHISGMIYIVRRIEEKGKACERARWAMKRARFCAAVEIFEARPRADKKISGYRKPERDAQAQSTVRSQEHLLSIWCAPGGRITGNFTRERTK